MRRHPRVHGLISAHLKRALLQAAFDVVLLKWRSVEQIPGKGPSIRCLTRKDKSTGLDETLLVSFRTSQNGWIAFTRDPSDTFWKALQDVSIVIVSCVEDPRSPRHALVHVFDSWELQERFDRAYRARRNEGAAIKPGTGVWLSLYDEEANSPVAYVGAGEGLASPPRHKVPLRKYLPSATGKALSSTGAQSRPGLTIPEARRQLALSLGVRESAIKIIVET